MNGVLPGRLSLELVPRTAWWQNVRSHVSAKDWEKCKRYARAKTPGGCCYICGQTGYDQGRNYPSEAHEIWSYDDERQIQTLVDIVPLCPRCHQCKHLGRARMHASPQQWARLIDHFQQVNEWSDGKVERYVMLAFQIWDIRSTMKWTLDISFLEELGIKPLEA